MIVIINYWFIIVCYSNLKELRYNYIISMVGWSIYNLNLGTESEEDGVRIVDLLK